LRHGDELPGDIRRGGTEKWLESPGVALAAGRWVADGADKPRFGGVSVRFAAIVDEIG